MKTKSKTFRVRLSEKEIDTLHQALSFYYLMAPDHLISRGRIGRVIVKLANIGEAAQ